MTTVNLEMRRFAALGVLKKALATGRALERVEGVEAALKHDPHLPEALVLLANEPEIERLPSAIFVRLGLTKAAHDEAWRWVVRERKASVAKEAPPLDSTAAGQVYLRAATAYAQALCEAGHFADGRAVYQKLIERQRHDGAGARILKAILDVRAADRSGIEKHRLDLGGSDDPRWLFANLFAAFRDGDEVRQAKILGQARARHLDVAKVLAAGRPRPSWLGTELESLWLMSAPARQWLGRQIEA